MDKTKTLDGLRQWDARVRKLAEEQGLPPVRYAVEYKYDGLTINPVSYTHLFGEANPCGKLSETWMRSTEDIPFGAHFGRRKIEVYRENIFMGYRFYDEAPERIRYPFGHGLSYTSFAYRDLDISPQDAWVEATLTVENTGGREGAEVVQLYAGRNADSAVFKAAKQLCAFEKIWLMPGESRRVSLRFPLKQLSLSLIHL